MRGRWLPGFFLIIFIPLVPFLIKTGTGASFQAPNACTQSLARNLDTAAPGCLPGADRLSRVEEFRAELLMSLDLFVRAQRALRADSGSYTRSIGRMPDVFGSLTHYYRIDVTRASQNQLLVVAVGEGGRTSGAIASQLVGDRIAIDENFQVHSNFPIPQPPRDYLHVVARTVMNRIWANQALVSEKHELELWEGVYRDFFKYEVKPVSNGGHTIVATGIAAPVLGDVVEMQPAANVYDWVYHHRHSSWAENEMHGHLEKIYLAEKIYQDHVGAYSPTFRGLLPMWNDLASLAVEQSPFVVQEFQLDPTFGFHAEVAQRQDAENRSRRNPSSVRALAVNGYGQVSEVSSIESIMQQFEQTRKQVADPHQLSDENPIGVAKKILPVSQPSAATQNMEPLVIDAVESEK